MKKYKILTVVAAMAAMFAFNPMSAKAANGDIIVQGQAYEVQDLDQYNTVNPIIAQKYEFDGFDRKDGVHKNVSPLQSFTLSEKSVTVIKTGATTNEACDFVNVSTALYGDSIGTSLIYQSKDVRSGENPRVSLLVLEPGTYYISTIVNQWNGFGSGKADLTGIASSSIAYIPVSKFYDIQQVPGAGFTTVNVKHHGGTFVQRVECSDLYTLPSQSELKAWSSYGYDNIIDANDMENVYTLDPGLNGYTFDSTGTSVYGINATLHGNEPYNYCHAFINFTVEVKSRAEQQEEVKPAKKDTKKPTVTGVKNGKKYTKAVKIKFKDASGIKYAKLNKKNIKSGYKVKKSGKYKLTVVDKAGNKRIIKFRVSIPKKRR